ncbi:MAG TPA: hypothetical protein PLH94_07655 [Fimbriimonadaceae bacterium]|nr:hypothetical protein [Fimbriimonadaceae bacterium]
MVRTSRAVEFVVALVEPRHRAVATKVAEPLLAEDRFRNDVIWANSKRWRFGFYFGQGDTRLWVPRRGAKAEPIDAERVLNFAHPLGRKAFRLLMFGYATGLALAGVVVAALFGVRW